jgi:hypothetical protein
MCDLCAILTYGPQFGSQLPPEQEAAVRAYMDADDGRTGPTYERMIAAGLPRWGEVRANV